MITANITNVAGQALISLLASSVYNDQLRLIIESSVSGSSHLQIVQSTIPTNNNFITQYWDENQINMCNNPNITCIQQFIFKSEFNCDPQIDGQYTLNLNDTLNAGSSTNLTIALSTNNYHCPTNMWSSPTTLNVPLLCGMLVLVFVALLFIWFCVRRRNRNNH